MALLVLPLWIRKCHPEALAPKGLKKLNKKLSAAPLFLCEEE
jgi:hypothetical protein